MSKCVLAFEFPAKTEFKLASVHRIGKSNWIFAQQGSFESSYSIQGERMRPKCVLAFEFTAKREFKLASVNRIGKSHWILAQQVSSESSLNSGEDLKLLPQVLSRYNSLTLLGVLGGWWSKLCWLLIGLVVGLGLLHRDVHSSGHLVQLGRFLQFSLFIYS